MLQLEVLNAFIDRINLVIWILLLFKFFLKASANSSTTYNIKVKK